MTFNHTVKYSIVRGFPRLFCSWMKSLTGYLRTIFTAWLGVLQLEIDGWRRDRHCKDTADSHHSLYIRVSQNAIRVHFDFEFTEAVFALIECEIKDIR